MIVLDCVCHINWGPVKIIWCEMERLNIGSVDGLLLNKFPTITWTNCWLNCQGFYRDPIKLPIIVSNDFINIFEKLRIAWTPQWVKGYMLSLLYTLTVHKTWMTGTNPSCTILTCRNKEVNVMQFRLIELRKNTPTWASVLKCMSCIFLFKLQ